MLAEICKKIIRRIILHKPNGSGFLVMNDMFGNPPNAVFLGLQALIDSSTEIQ
jgi:mannose/fructose-specific phosphotransferase system component IIA